MPQQIQKTNTKQATEEGPVEQLPGKSEKGEELKADIDALLDEIDEVLEVNAEEFVTAYKQHGGQ